MNAESRQPQPEPIQCSLSDSFHAWLSQAGGALAITTYQAGKVVLAGWNGVQVTLLLRQFDKPMGLAVGGARLALATRHEVWLLANAPLLARDYLETQPGLYDALYLPRVAYFTGDLNVHDLAFGHAALSPGEPQAARDPLSPGGRGAEGEGEELWIANTRFSCLAALSQDYSFVPRWHPPFISQVAPEDRCHLNGLAMIDGQPRYVTALGESDEVGGWRPGKASGGIVIGVETGEIVLRGLSMPHSPRWYRGQLWLLNSGTGELCVVDLQRGSHTVVCALPGYLRGLAFAGPFALVGLSQIREKHIFGGLPVQERFARLLCAVAVVDLRTGNQVGLLEFTAGVQELYDVQFLPGVCRPTILNLERQAARQAFTAPEFSYWLRPSALVADEAIENTR